MISLKILKIRKRYFLLGVKSDEDPIYYYSKKKIYCPHMSGLILNGLSSFNIWAPHAMSASHKPDPLLSAPFWLIKRVKWFSFHLFFIDWTKWKMRRGKENEKKERRREGSIEEEDREKKQRHQQLLAVATATTGSSSDSSQHRFPLV